MFVDSDAVIVSDETVFVDLAEVFSITSSSADVVSTTGALTLTSTVDEVVIDVVALAIVGAN